MKFLVLSALLAVASASHLVSHPNGAVVPADTPAIAHAKAQHFAAKGYPHGGVYAHGPAHGLAHGLAHHAAPYAHGYAHGAAAYPVAGYTPLVSHPNGAVTPVDTPDVAAAKAAHVAAGGSAHYAAGYPYAHGIAHHGIAHHGPAHHGFAHAAHHGGYAAPYAHGYHGLVAHPNGAVVPVEAPENQAARAAHFAAHAKAY